MPQVLIPTIREMSSWGPEDPHIPKPHQLAKAIAEHLEIAKATKVEVDFLADRLMDKLESALMYYQLIMADDYDGRNLSQKRTIYEGLYANLWSFFKGRVQNYIHGMGWDVSFIFCKEKNFKQEAKKFVTTHPERKDAVEFASKQRASWQSAFGHSRNVAEHSGDYRDGTSAYESPDDAKRLFAQVCWSAESWMAYFGSYTLAADWNVSEVKPNATIFDRDPRYIVEHAVMTAQREKQEKKK
jgi:hypothetical protein